MMIGQTFEPRHFHIPGDQLDGGFLAGQHASERTPLPPTVDGRTIKAGSSAHPAEPLALTLLRKARAAQHAIEPWRPLHQESGPLMVDPNDAVVKRVKSFHDVTPLGHEPSEHPGSCVHTRERTRTPGTNRRQQVTLDTNRQATIVVLAADLEDHIVTPLHHLQAMIATLIDEGTHCVSRCAWHLHMRDSLVSITHRRCHGDP